MQATALKGSTEFVEALGEQWRVATETGASIALAMIAVDHFAAYRRDHGEDNAIECARRVSGALRWVLTRSNDILSSFESGEFAIIFPHTCFAGASLVLDKVRAVVAALEVPAQSRLTRVTLSVGLAALRAAGDNAPHELIDAARGALDQAKRGPQAQP